MCRNCLITVMVIVLIGILGLSFFWDCLMVLVIFLMCFSRCVRCWVSVWVLRRVVEWFVSYCVVLVVSV